MITQVTQHLFNEIDYRQNVKNELICLENM